MVCFIFIFVAICSAVLSVCKIVEYGSVFLRRNFGSRLVSFFEMRFA